jgi:hypothetical protein
MSNNIPEYEAVSSALKDVEKEFKRYEALQVSCLVLIGRSKGATQHFVFCCQKRQQKLHKAISDAAGVNDGETTMTVRHFNELKKLYADLVCGIFRLLFVLVLLEYFVQIDCCQRTHDDRKRVKM